MWISVLVLAVAVVAATRWMRLMETRVDALNARIAELEEAIRQRDDRSANSHR